MTLETNFDGLVGPTHHYGALAAGNRASQRHGHRPSNPKAAALQGIAKMRALLDLGYSQGVIPPQERPHLPTLRRLGFTGDDRAILARVAKEAPALLSQVSSSASMWVANAATVSPSADTCDGRVHFTPANLNASLHRSLEHPTTARALSAIFKDPTHFAHHPALPDVATFGDEGAANHTRLCADYDQPGIGFFVYGREALSPNAPRPRRYPARQTLEASQAVARQHGLSAGRVVFAQQTPDAIDAGVFHNDVIAVGNQRVLFYHQRAFLESDRVLSALDSALERLGTELVPIEVPSHRVSLEDAVASYLFNSQLLDAGNDRMRLIVPQECLSTPSVHAFLDELLKGNGPISDVQAFDLKQSMQNGGGPACLRLRVALTERERAAVAPGALMTHERLDCLTAWVERHYRDRLSAEDLFDPSLLEEVHTALDELTHLLGLGALYDFQRQGEI
ncbi:N-succinylarginine dihydrolase [Larsenimonas salina]|uniref:N-succinylarginine dihydrolase n=1 Tax=Larsenimonas salina TaxID=1295565 RepID=UPI002073746A|nr:N-succinylarginine dihydrolase [Larsenimonas salina]MCM5703305.1 N-succinylarginine dihydrolase [Larsenimonas salina]